jgi:hypothetical protein
MVGTMKAIVAAFLFVLASGCTPKCDDITAQFGLARWGGTCHLEGSVHNGTPRPLRYLDVELRIGTPQSPVFAQTFRVAFGRKGVRRIPSGMVTEGWGCDAFKNGRVSQDVGNLEDFYKTGAHWSWRIVRARWYLW